MRFFVGKGGGADRQEMLAKKVLKVIILKQPSKTLYASALLFAVKNTVKSSTRVTVKFFIEASLLLTVSLVMFQ